MRIAFDVNDVLRNTFFKSEQIYRKHYLSENENLEMSKYDEELGEWVSADLVKNDFEYGLNLPIESLNLIEHFKFPNSEDLFNFFYVDFAMEIFGNSPSTSNNTFNVLNDFYKKFRDENEILIISDEIEKSKPATLFFLAKNGCLIEKIKFYSTVTKNTLWDECDLIITANPDIIESSPDNLTIVKYNTSYNKSVKCKYSLSDISEIFDLIKKLK